MEVKKCAAVNSESFQHEVRSSVMLSIKRNEEKIPKRKGLTQTAEKADEKSR